MTDQDSTVLGDPTTEATGHLSPRQAEELVAGYPGSAVVMSRGGDILYANERASGVVALLRNDALPDVHDMIVKSIELKTVTAGAVSVATARGDILLEITVVPQDDEISVLVLTRDLTMERNLRSALVESRQRYKDLVEVSSDFYWETDASGTFVFVSPRGGIGFDTEALIGRLGSEFVVDPETFSPLPFVSPRAMEDIEMWFRHKNGDTLCMMVSCVPLFREDGENEEWTGARGVCRDVTDERRSEAALARARQREQTLNYIVSSVRDELDPQNMLSAAAAATARALNSAGCRIHRLSESQDLVIAADFGNIESLDGLEEALSDLELGRDVQKLTLGTWEFAAVATHYRQTVNGAITIWKSKKSDAWEDDQLILIADIANQLGIANEQVTNHERIVALSRTDSMTGLLNRRAFFEEEIPRRVARLERSRQTAALFYVDMDNFKRVNDVRGHQAGDDAIMLLRDLMMDFSRPGDVIARLGGDEFAMWLDGISAEVTNHRAQALIDASQPLKAFSGDDDHPLGISVGVAMFDPDLSEPLESLLSRADSAMYEIKNAGKGGFCVAPPPGTASATKAE